MSQALISLLATLLTRAIALSFDSAPTVIESEILRNKFLKNSSFSSKWGPQKALSLCLEASSPLGVTFSIASLDRGSHREYLQFD